MLVLHGRAVSDSPTEPPWPAFLPRLLVSFFQGEAHARSWSVPEGLSRVQLGESARPHRRHHPGVAKIAASRYALRPDRRQTRRAEVCGGGSGQGFRTAGSGADRPHRTEFLPLAEFAARGLSPHFCGAKFG